MWPKRWQSQTSHSSVKTANMMKIVFYVLVSLAVVFGDDLVEKFIKGNHLFAQDVYNVLLQNNKDNILVSPFSAEVVLGLAQSGARGTTGDEIRSVFHFGTSKEDTEEQFKSVLPLLQSDWVSIFSSNEIFVSERYKVNQEFVQTALDVYQSGSQEVNFAQTAEAAAIVNERVKEMTNNLIDDFIDASDFNDQAVVLLLNVLYFQGNWSVPFGPESTRRATFFKTSTTTIQTDMLFQYSEYYNYYYSAELDAQFLELPFEGDEAKMTIVLPNMKEGISFLEKQVPDVFTKPEYTSELVQVLLPKFKIETKLDVVDVLRKLGLKQALSFQDADFSRIAGAKGQLYISGAGQKAVIEVNEIGVTAAAVTGIGRSVGVVPPGPTKLFWADHPFVFYITFKDIILFQGRVLSPES